MNKRKIDNMINMYTNDNLGCHTIGKKYGLSCNQIARILVKEGITLRTLNDSRKLRSIYNSKYDNIDYFKNIDTPDKAYWLGFIFADGSVYKGNSVGMKIGLQPQDYKHLDKIADIFKGKRYFSQGKEFVSITNASLCEDLINKGVYPNKTYRDDYNYTFDSLSEELKSHFLRGLFDGDGTICFDKRRNSLMLGFIATKQFSNQIQDFLSKTLEVTNVKIRHFEHYSSFQYQSKKDITKILEYLYKDTDLYLERKYNLYLENKDKLNYLKPSNQHLKKKEHIKFELDI